MSDTVHQIVAPLVVAVVVSAASGWVTTQVALATLEARLSAVEAAARRNAEQRELLIRLDERVSRLVRELERDREEGR